ncbi:MAG: hypothetical protein IPG88_23200 [Gemmatimonadetes bacterium]|nr:hypothetical protein [Gemmatimonadota bacterium]
MIALALQHGQFQRLRDRMAHRRHHVHRGRAESGPGDPHAEQDEEVELRRTSQGHHHRDGHQPGSEVERHAAGHAPPRRIEGYPQRRCANQQQQAEWKEDGHCPQEDLAREDRHDAHRKRAHQRPRPLFHLERMHVEGERNQDEWREHDEDEGEVEVA